MKIIPTILARSKEELVRQLQKTGPLSDTLQIDIVGNGFGTPTIAVDNLELPENKRIIFHIMDRTILDLEPYRHFNPYRIIIQSEVKNWQELTSNIEKTKLGLAISPETVIDSRVESLLKNVSEVLILTVKPGEQGREFQKNQLGKIKQIKNVDPSVVVSVDGGINEANITDIKNAGANIAYVGSALSQVENSQQTFDKLKSAI